MRSQVGLYLVGSLALALSLSRVSAATLSTAVFSAVFVLFVLCVLDEFLHRFHMHDLRDVEPRPGGVAVVTGASSGLGREIAYVLAEKRFHLVLVGRSKDTLTRMATELHDVWDIDVHVCVADLSLAAGPVQVMEFVTSNALQVDILVNCAGAMQRGPFASHVLPDVTSMMQLNTTSAVALCHLVLPGMLERTCGRILNIASIAAASPMPLAATYAASKAFLVRFTQALNYECRHKVGVTAFCPGPMRTPFFDAGHPAPLLLNLPLASDPKDVATRAVAAMLAGTETAFDSWTSMVCYHGGVVFGEFRLAALFSAVCWSAPADAAAAIL
ncbi:Aste57867_2736 [Aphanomyces stellatus]|uniref:Aste57867_2736 protein n=1 Tax=Aphanomyces stellatus TaxID=120398 RepID=A0A485K886_9STRA|nr:hypothetical protein As57867_002729 [Aphanomyces stellatus]VFT79928.1 Aste57867_2736 [Aphanomyces stellatus]